MNIKSTLQLIIRPLAILLFGLVLISCVDSSDSEIEQDAVKNEAINAGTTIHINDGINKYTNK